MLLGAELERGAYRTGPVGGPHQVLDVDRRAVVE